MVRQHIYIEMDTDYAFHAKVHCALIQYKDAILLVQEITLCW